MNSTNRSEEDYEYRLAVFRGLTRRAIAVGSDGSVWRRRRDSFAQSTQELPPERDYWSPVKGVSQSPVAVDQQDDGRELRASRLDLFVETFPGYPIPERLESLVVKRSPPVKTPPSLETLGTSDASKAIRKPPLSTWLGILRPGQIDKALPAIQVPRIGDNPTLIGDAFDCLVKFCLHKASGRAEKRFEWPYRPPTAVLLDASVFQAYSNAVVQAVDTINQFLFSDTEFSEASDELVSASLTIAKAKRSHFGAGTQPIDVHHDGDVIDLRKLLQKFPFKEVMTDKPIQVSPGFGVGSSALGGAVGDLLIGNTLFDVKVSQSPKIEREWIDQVFFYAQLQAFAIQRGEARPPIENVGVISARHGIAVTWPIRWWEEHPMFPEFREQLFSRLLTLLSSHQAASGARVISAIPTAPPTQRYVVSETAFHAAGSFEITVGQGLSLSSLQIGPVRTKLKQRNPHDKTP